MNEFWNNNRWAILTFATVCAAVVISPFVVDMSAAYYIDHSVVIPFWERALIGMGVFVRLVRWPILLAAGLLVSVLSFVRNRGSLTK